MEEFINYITINVSEFYRNPALWKTLEDVILPDLISKFGENLKIWSAACSTGDEPYSLAMVMAKKVPDCRMNIKRNTLRKWATVITRFRMTSSGV